jgi:hypothetical protein
MSDYIRLENEHHNYWAYSPATWGPYYNETWCSPGGINNAKVQLIIGTIRQNAHLFEGRPVFIGGGLLQPWHSWDIDLYIEGGWTAGSKQMLEWCVNLGFQHQIFIDAKLVSKFADVRVWQDTRKVETFTTLVFSNKFKSKTGINSLKQYTPYRDVFATQQTIPFEKNVTMDELGFVYEYGVQIL